LRIGSFGNEAGPNSVRPRAGGDPAHDPRREKIAVAENPAMRTSSGLFGSRGDVAEITTDQVRAIFDSNADTVVCSALIQTTESMALALETLFEEAGTPVRVSINLTFPKAL
jgi:hypothetical protein